MFLQDEGRIGPGKAIGQLGKSRRQGLAVFNAEHYAAFVAHTDGLAREPGVTLFDAHKPQVTRDQRAWIDPDHLAPRPSLRLSRELCRTTVLPLLLGTADGGRTWQNQPSGTDHSLMDVEFVTPAFGLAVGLDSIILKTYDGGKTWTPEKPTVKTHYYGVTFRRYGPDVVRHDAFAVGQGVIAYYSYLKKSYLQNWMPAAEMKYDITYNWLYKIAFNARTGEEGIAVGQNGLVLRTPSGGHEWLQVEYPAKQAAQVLNP